MQKESAFPEDPAAATVIDPLAIVDANAVTTRRLVYGMTAEMARLREELSEAQHRIEGFVAIIKAVPEMEGNTHHFAVPACSFCEDPVGAQQESERHCPTCDAELPCLDWCSHERDELTARCINMNCGAEICYKCWAMCDDCKEWCCDACVISTGPELWRCGYCNRGHSWEPVEKRARGQGEEGMDLEQKGKSD